MTRKEAMYCMRAHMEYPKSICTRCKYRYATQPCEVRTAYKMAADALDESSMIDRVLEIIEGFVESRFYPDGGTDYYIEDVEGLEDAIESLKGGDVE